MPISRMKQYYYSKDTLYLYVNENLTQPFLCPVEAEPLKFKSSAECLQFLKENNIEGSVLYKLTSFQ